MKCGLICLKSGLAVPLKKIDVTVTIGAAVGHVESVSLYQNEFDEPIEAIFAFPLDEQSAVYKFVAEINNRVIVAECQEKEQARETYDDAIQSGHTAFLLEEHDETSDIFQCRLGNLPPGGTAKLTMAYVSELSHEVDGRVRFTLPNVLNPRYGTSNTEAFSSSSGLFGSGMQNTTDTICINTCQYEMSFIADIQSQSKIHSIVSDSDNIKVEYSNENRRAQVTLAESFKPEHDLTLLIQYQEINQPQAITERGSSTGNGLMKLDVLMLSFYPDISDIKGNVTNLGEYVFVIDRSGSMAGSKMDKTKDTLLLFLKSLPVGCYFNIVSFGNAYDMLFKTPNGASSTDSCSREYNQQNLEMALQLQQTMKADMGGTEILQPLEAIYKKSLVPGHPRQIILLTDGEVWNTQDIKRLVGSNASNTRVFTVGIGEGASTALVKGVARAGKGRYEFVKGLDRLQQKVMSILKCSMQPTVTNVNISWELPTFVSAVTVPQDVPNIFSGEELILYALIEGDENQVEEINGLKNGLSSTITKCIPNLTISGFIGDVHLVSHGKVFNEALTCPLPQVTRCPLALQHEQYCKETICGTVKLSGEIEDKSFEHCLEFTASGHVEDTDTSAPIHRLAAKAQIKELEDKELIEDLKRKPTGFSSFQSQQKDEKYKQQIILVSTGANIVSKYTSFVGVDKESKVAVKLEKPKPPVAMFGCSAPGGPRMYGTRISGGGMFGSTGSNLFGAAHPMPHATFGSSAFGGGGGGGTMGGGMGGGGGGMFGSKPINSSSSSSGGFPFAMRTNTGFAAATQVPSAFPASGQVAQPASTGMFGAAFIDQQQQQPTGFSFGASNAGQRTADSNTATSGFSFGSSAQDPFAPLGGAPIDLHQQQAPQQQQPQTTGFSFGSSSGFSFGSSVQNQITFADRNISSTNQEPRGMMGLIYLQNFEGSWSLNENFAKVIGIPLDVLTASCNSNLAVWSTCLALAWLHKYFSAQRDEWEMIERKALSWLPMQKTGNGDWKTIMATAQTFIQQNSMPPQ